MIRSINCIRMGTHSYLGKNSLDFVRKNRCWIKNAQQKKSTTTLVCEDKDNEALSDIQESVCAVKNSIFFNSQKRNDIDTAIENILSKPPVPTK